MQAFNLAATSRELTGKKVSQLRSKGLIPACVYGGGATNKNLSIEYGVFEKMYRDAGESSLVDLSVDGGASVKVLVHDVQTDAMYGRMTHVDFRQVNMNEKLEAEVEISLIGESPAVKGIGAVLQQVLDSVTVYCLPGDLVSEIAVDLSVLKEFGDAVRVKDLVPPPGIEFHNGPEEVIVIANEPISEEDLKKLDEAVTVDVSTVKTAAEEKKAADEAKAAAEGTKEE
jgi:large subunit ribosomal protein L25